MKNLKKMIATLGLVVVMLAGTSAANAGIIMIDSAPSQTGAKECSSNDGIIILNRVGIIILNRVVGVSIEVESNSPCSDGMLVSDRTGMLISD